MLFEYQIPVVSPVYQLGKMTVRRKGRVEAAVNKFASLTKSKSTNNTIYSFANSRIEATISSGLYLGKWVSLFQGGLADLIVKLFDEYKDIAQIKLCFQGDRLRLFISSRIGGTYLRKSNDFVVQNARRIWRTITLLVEMCMDDFNNNSQSQRMGV